MGHHHGRRRRSEKKMAVLPPQSGGDTDSTMQLLARIFFLKSITGFNSHSQPIYTLYSQEHFFPSHRRIQQPSTISSFPPPLSFFFLTARNFRPLWVVWLHSLHSPSPLSLFPRPPLFRLSSSSAAAAVQLNLFPSSFLSFSPPVYFD